MASMTAQNVIDKARFYLNDDDSSSTRWSDDVLWPLVNDAVVHITELRPDALYDSTGALITLTPATSEASTLSIDDKWIVPAALYVAAQAMNKQAGQLFNEKKIALILAQFNNFIQV